MTNNPAWLLAAAAHIALAPALASAQPATTSQPATPQPLPVRPGVPGSPREELGIDRAPPLLREGAFVSSARAVLAKGQTGRTNAVFDPDARGRKMPPMILLPSANLAAIERIAPRITGDAADASRPRILITGQVFAYQGHNYLLPTAPPIMETATADVPPAQTPSVQTPPAEPAANDQPGEDDAAPAKPTDPTHTDTPDEPSIDDIVGELDRALGSRRATNPVAADDPAAEPEPATEASDLRVRPAGFMTARRGRIIRSGTGDPLFVIDSGAGDPVQEPPLTLLPCTNLNAIETLAERMGESATFTLSGQLTVYKGRNYLLPTTFTVNRKTDQVIPNQ